MKKIWNTVQLVFAGIGGWLGYFVDGCDGLLYGGRHKTFLMN